MSALWAWETFGGLGSRTRRGFGAIGRVDRPPSRASEIEHELARRQTGTIDWVPTLTGSRFGMGKSRRASCLEAWKDGLGALQRIRQGVGIGRNPPAPHSMSPAGRSRWPEADEIRRLTTAAPKHSEPFVTVSRFPRAVFGMPIVFHFHPGSPNDPGSQGDPNVKPLQLQPEMSDRFASPVILRPLQDETGFRAAALVLSSKIPATILVAGSNPTPAEWRLDPHLAAQIPALQRPGGPPFTDPVQLLLAELKR
jgi:CRISPR-associated protein Cmr1